MTEEEINKKITSREFLVDTICGAANPLSYSEDEIYATLPKEEADEFIRLREEVKAMIDDECAKAAKYATHEDETLMAAEDNSSYKVPNVPCED